MTSKYVLHITMSAAAGKIAIKDGGGGQRTDF